MGICGAFGAYAGFSVSTNYGYYVHDGKVGLGAADDGWRDYVSWMNKMCSEGLLDQDMLTEDDTTIKDKIHNEKCGVSYTSMGQLNIWNKEEEAALFRLLTFCIRRIARLQLMPIIPGSILMKMKRRTERLPAVGDIQLVLASQPKNLINLMR